MTKYHINKSTGEAGLCRAKQGKCPFGSTEEHFESERSARDSYELSMNEAMFSNTQKKFKTPIPEKFYHVALKSNQDSILATGLQPSVGDRSLAFGEEEKRVYLFDSLESVDSALGSWLGEEFAEDELVLLSISSRDVEEPQPEFDDEEGSFEWTTTKSINSSSISVEPVEI